MMTKKQANVAIEELRSWAAMAPRRSRLKQMLIVTARIWEAIDRIPMSKEQRERQEGYVCRMWELIEGEIEGRTDAVERVQEIAQDWENEFGWLAGPEESSENEEN
jgi:hypothetical protein